MNAVLVKKGSYFVVEDGKGNILCKTKDFGEADIFANKMGKVDYAVETFPESIRIKLGFTEYRTQSFKEVFSTLVLSCIKSNPPDEILVRLSRMIARSGVGVKRVEEVGEDELHVYLEKAPVMYRIFRNNREWSVRRVHLRSEQSD